MRSQRLARWPTAQWILAATFLAATPAGPAPAQMVAPSTAPSAAAGTDIEGRWSGYVLCDQRGWAVFLDVSGSASPYLARWTYVGSSNGEVIAEVVETGADSYELQTAGENVDDYAMTLKPGGMVGRSINLGCDLMLVRPL